MTGRRSDEAPAATHPRNTTITITVPRFWARPAATSSGKHAHPTERTPGKSPHHIGLGAAALATIVAVSITGDSPLIHTELDSHESSTSSSIGTAAALTPVTSPPTVSIPGVPTVSIPGAPTVSIPGGPVLSPSPTGGPGQQLFALPAAAPQASLPAAPKVGESSAPQQLSSSGIPARAKAAYITAAGQVATLAPGCKLPWTLIAAIGRVESNHARYGGSTLIASSGRALPAILGVRLDGSKAGTSVIRDTDRGTLDGDPQYDRAVGPMQFMPATWRAFALDADGDGATNPQDIDDAALAAGRYLCTGATATADLSTAQGQWSAAFRYNRSTNYANLVLALSTTYATGKPAIVVQPKNATTTVPTVTLTVTPGPVPTPTTAPTSTTTVTQTSTSSAGATVTTTVTAPSTTSASTGGSVVTVTVTVVTVTVTGQPITSTTTSTGR